MVHIMVLLDVIIEPFAVHYGLWIWKGRVLPSIANYVAWFFGGCIVTSIWLNFWQKTENCKFCPQNGRNKREKC